MTILEVLFEILAVRQRILSRAREAGESDQVVDLAELDVLEAKVAILREQASKGD